MKLPSILDRSVLILNLCNLVKLDGVDDEFFLSTGRSTKVLYAIFPIVMST